MSVGISTLGNSGFGGEQKLTAATKAKLERLGIDTSNIKTENEGKMLLKIAVQENINKAKTIGKNEDNNIPQIPQWILEIANELNISYTNSGSTENLVNQIITILEEKIAKSDNLAEKTQYTEKLKKVKQMSKTQNKLYAEMDITAYMNIAYFGFNLPKGPSY